MYPFPIESKFKFSYLTISKKLSTFYPNIFLVENMGQLKYLINHLLFWVFYVQYAPFPNVSSIRSRILLVYIFLNKAFVNHVRL